MPPWNLKRLDKSTEGQRIMPIGHQVLVSCKTGARLEGAHEQSRSKHRSYLETCDRIG